MKLENYDVPQLTSYAPLLFGCNAFVLKTRKRVIPAAEVQGMTRVGRRTKEGWGGRGRGNMRGGKGGDKGGGSHLTLGVTKLVINFFYGVHFSREPHYPYYPLEGPKRPPRSS